MKILFICSCLEPGRDGVGDYTRRLSRELTRRGHSCFLLSLNDRFVESATRTRESASESSEPDAPHPIQVLRLPEKSGIDQILPEAKKFCEEAAPDWISLQLVLYGFDPRGLCFRLGTHLQKLCGEIPVQIMFHELWIGEALQSSLKHKILGKLQQHILKDLLRRLKPAVVHTHTPLYIYLLSKLGCSAIKLPLFGNVPLQADTTNSMVLKALDIPASDRHRWSIFTIFGSIHPEWNGEDFLDRAKSTIRASGKQPAFVAVGRLGSIGEEIWKRMEARQDFSCKWLSLGEQPVEVISQCLLASDFGVSSVPPEYLFKSGTAIAMLEHGLPVITTRPVGRYSNCPESVLQERLPNNFRHLDFGKMSKLTPRELLPEIAGQFVRDLDLAGEKKGATA